MEIIISVFALDGASKIQVTSLTSQLRTTKISEQRSVLPYSVNLDAKDCVNILGCSPFLPSPALPFSEDLSETSRKQQQKAIYTLAVRGSDMTVLHSGIVSIPARQYSTTHIITINFH